MSAIELAIQRPAALDAAERFHRLADDWRLGTRGTSSLTDLILHPAYQQVIGLGPVAVPLILRELEANPAHWFWALFSITGENPVPPEAAGDLDRMTAVWLEWGRSRGFV